MNLVELAKNLPVVHSSTYDQALVGGNPETISDVHAALAVLINLGVRRMGGITVAHVVSPTALTVLQSAANSGFALMAPGTNPPMEGGLYVGTFNQVPMFIDRYANDAEPVRTISFNKDGDLRVSEVLLKNIRFF